MATGRKGRSPMTLEVRRTEWLTPHMIRVVAGGDGIAGYRHNHFTDRYVKLVFPPPGVDLPEHLDLDAVRRDRPPEEWPRLRTYTVRGYDPVAGELWIDFVHHGDHGIAARWAAKAQPGDRLRLFGPGGAYAPDPDADWHLFVGDEAALPAIASALAEVPDHAPIVGVLETADGTTAPYVDVPARADVRWVRRDEGGPGLLGAVTALDFPPGRVHAFVHGELATILDLRRHLRDERGIPAEHLSLSGYWRAGKDEDRFQAEKRALADTASTRT